MNYVAVALNEIAKQISLIPSENGVLSLSAVGTITVVKLRNAKEDIALMRLTRDTGALVGIFPSTEFYEHLCPILESMNTKFLIVGDFELSDKAFAIEQSMMASQIVMALGETVDC